MKELNSLVKGMLGKPMTKKQKRLLESLRRKVKVGELTVKEAHKIWNKMVKKNEEK